MLQKLQQSIKQSEDEEEAEDLNERTSCGNCVRIKGRATAKQKQYTYLKTQVYDCIRLHKD